MNKSLLNLWINIVNEKLFNLLSNWEKKLTFFINKVRRYRIESLAKSLQIKLKNQNIEVLDKVD